MAHADTPIRPIELDGMDHISYMREALALAAQAGEAGDVPVGAVVVRDGTVVGRGFNRREAQGDPTAHAEILALRDAARTLGGWYLHSCVLYSTVEPCPMCAGAAIQARIPAICYGARDARAGCCGSVLDLPGSGRFLHTAQIRGGILEEECAALMRAFFRQRRSKKENE
ncbi:MAG: tRNA adenosine(34) deaminase TadA [Eubacteriales bacterium]|nr:tRNA adenosine(34) deaminase TadA [Eubacteriales bacterium]